MNGVKDANGTLTAYEEFAADLMSLDSLSLGLFSPYKDMISRVGVVFSCDEASGLGASCRFSMVDRDGLSDDVYNGAVYDTVRVTQQLSTLCSCDGMRFENNDESAEPFDSHGSTTGSSISDSSTDSDRSDGSDAANDRTVTAVDAGENDTDTAGDGAAVDQKEADDYGDEGDVGMKEDDAYSSFTNPPTR